MENFMDYSCGIAGMAVIKEAQEETAIALAKAEVEKAMQRGYKYFWLALTGEGSLCYAQGIKAAISGHNGVSLEIMAPYPAWINEQSQPDQYKKILHGVPIEYANQLNDFGLAVMVTNHVMDLSAHMIVFSDGKDKDSLAIIKHIEDSEMSVTVVSLE